MQRINIFKLAIEGITTVLLFGIAFAANADVMMKALPAPVVAKPPNPNTTIAPKTVLPTVPAAGALLKPDAACLNNISRVNGINGKLGGIVFFPGLVLNITGCGFGNSGQVALIGVGPLFIDGWTNTNIIAHIDPALSHVRDIDSGVKLYIKPMNATEILSQATFSFKAVHQETVIPLRNPQNGVFSSIYGKPNAIVVGNLTRVTRNLQGQQCPAVEFGHQNDVMWDEFQFYISDDSVPNGVGTLSGSAGPDHGPFVVTHVNFTNETDQSNWNNQGMQTVIVGNGGSAEYDSAKSLIKVIFQGHSTYSKGKNSSCTSGYTVSLNVNAPRGFKPVAIVHAVQGQAAPIPRANPTTGAVKK